MSASGYRPKFTNRFDKIYIPPDGLIKHVIGGEYGIRNWADSVYAVWGCVQLNIKGTSAIVEIGDAKVLGNIAKPPAVVIMDTEHRDLVAPRNGMMIYNSDLNVLQGVVNGVWVTIQTGGL